MRPRLLIIGDSISLGAAEIRGSNVVARIEASYVNLLTSALPEVDLIVDGDVHRTTTGGRHVLPMLLDRERPGAVLIMLGGNDADLDWRRFVLSNGAVIRNRLSVATYQSNLRAIAGMSLAAGAAPILTDMPNHHFELRGPYLSQLVGKDVSSMLDRGGGQDASDRQLDAYRLAVASVANELRVPLARYGPTLGAHPPREMTGVDGVHPSAAAHQLIAQVLLPTIRDALNLTVTVHPCPAGV